MIRYRTRDLTRLLPGTARPSYRRMEKVTGRTDDMMIVRGVNVFPTQIEEQILKVGGLAPHYLCVLTRPGRMDELTVRVEAHDEGRRPPTRAARSATSSAVSSRTTSASRIDVEVHRAARPRTLPRQGQAHRRPAPPHEPAPTSSR